MRQLGWLFLLITSFAGGQSVTIDTSYPEAKTTAERVQRDFAVILDPFLLSLEELKDIEQRLTVCDRLRKSYGVTADYKTSSLASLIDVEMRLSKCASLRTLHGINLDYREYSLDRLKSMELTLSASQRVESTYKDLFTWRKSSPVEKNNERDPAEKQALAEAFEQARTSIYLGNTGSPNPAAFKGYHYVDPYLRRDGIYVRGHMKTNSDYRFWNNWSSFGNTNPFTGEIGTKRQ